MRPNYTTPAFVVLCDDGGACNVWGPFHSAESGQAWIDHYHRGDDGAWSVLEVDPPDA